jgi:hypothetical protein
MLLKNAALQGIISGLWQQTAEANTATTGGAAKTPKFAKKDWDPDTQEVFIEFGNGTKLALDCKQLNEEMRVSLMLHGAAQKIGDSYAGVKGNFAEGIENAKGVISQLLAGEWTGGGDEGRPRLAELAAAIARIKGTDPEKTLAAVEKASDDQRKAWRSNAQVKAVIAQQRAEKAQKALEGATREEVNIQI